MSEQRLVSVVELATVLDMHPNWVREKARNGDLPCFNLGTARKPRYKFDVDAVLAKLHEPVVDPWAARKRGKRVAA